MLSPKKYILYAYIKPYDLKLCLVFPVDVKIRFIQEYIEDTMRNFRSKYKVGRIEHKKTSSILLPDFKIGEILENKDELIVYSIEYGLTKKNLNNKNSLEDIDKLFIGKKVKRESRVASRKISIDKINTKNIKDNNTDEDKNEESDESNEEDNKDNNKDNNKNKDDNNNNDDDKKNEDEESNEDEDDYDEGKEENNKKNNIQKKKLKKKSESEVSSNSGEDNSEDIKV